MNDCVLDKNHTLKFYSVEEFEKIMNISSQYEPPKIVPKSELQKWLLDPEFRDQYYYLTVKGDSFLFVNWFDHLEKKPNNALTIESIKTPEILSVEFSTNGSYLIALNKLVN